MHRTHHVLASAALFIALLTAGPALAGKGDKGKPGGGGGGDGGGSTTTALEIAYAVHRDGTTEIVAGPADGSSSDFEQVSPADGTATSYADVAWSPDGRAIAAARGSASPVVIDLDTGVMTAVVEGHDSAYGYVSWTRRRDPADASGNTLLPYEEQMIMKPVGRAWGQRPWGDPYTLTSTNLELISADPQTAPNTAVKLTDFGWWYAEGELLATEEHARNGIWVGERSDVTDRAWVVYEYHKNTYRGTGSTWEDGWTEEQVQETRILTLDTSAWPTVSILADEPFTALDWDSNFRQFDVSADGRWCVQRVGQTLERIPLTVETVAGVDTLDLDTANKTIHDAPTGSLQGVAIDGDGSRVAADVFVSKGWGWHYVYVLDVATGSWTQSSNKSEEYVYSSGIAFAPTSGS